MEPTDTVQPPENGAGLGDAPSTPPNTETSSSTPPIEPQPPTEPAAPEPPTVSQGDASGKKFGMSRLTTLLVAFVVLVVGSTGGYYLGSSTEKSKADKAEAKLQDQLTAANSTDHALPTGAYRDSDCVPNMGYHYLLKTSNKTYGPFILVNRAGKVIGVEYMADPALFVKIPNTNPPVELIAKNSSLYGWKYDHVEIDHVPLGHPGLLRDHIDVHLYTVDQKGQLNACK